jgi:HD-GYP domain-containing protein (c-di-GMP phosphodiesterase class II)
MLALDFSHEEIALGCLASQLHDIGKVSLPRNLLQKSGPLTLEEQMQIRHHPTVGMEILQECEGVLGQIATIVATHHERWDGSGYPYGLQGEKIPALARIIAITDAYDAIIHERPYRRMRTSDEALAEIEYFAGRHFDPTFAATFVRMIRTAGEEAA